MDQNPRIQASGTAAASSDQVAHGATASVGRGASQKARNAEWTNTHAINIRLSIPLPLGRYYMAFVAGKERRSPRRRKPERLKHPVATLGNLAFLSTLGVVTGLALFAVIQLVARFVLERAGMV